MDSTYETASGLLVTDRRRHLRASEVPQVDPRSHDPNVNPAVGSVGPHSSTGLVHDPSSWHAESWDGWPADWRTPYSGEQWSGYGYGRDPSFGRVATAMTCVDLNSRQLASFPVYGMRAEEPFTLPRWSTNPEPALYSGWSDFMHQVVNSMQMRGEAFLYATARYADGYPQRFAVLNPDAVGVEWIDGRVEYLVDGEPVDAADICHLRYQSVAGRLRGVSPLEWVARSLMTAASLERYATNLSTRGGIPWAVLKSPKNIDGKQARDAQEAWVEASARRDGAPAVIGNAFELEALSFSPSDMALLDLREFDERRICAAFGVPAYLINVTMASGTTYANASQLFLHHWTATLRPLAQVIAEAWSSWLLPHGSTMEFNADRYTQPPLGERANAWLTLHNIVDPATGKRAITVDEIRAAERLTTLQTSATATATTAADDTPLAAAVDLAPSQRLTGRAA